MITDINSEDRLVQTTFADHLRDVLGWESIYAHNEQAQRHVREGLSEEELAFFDLLTREKISKADRERIKQASKELLATIKCQLASMPAWTKNAATQAEVKVLILDKLYSSLPRPPFTEEEVEAHAERLYGFVWQQSELVA